MQYTQQVNLKCHDLIVDHFSKILAELNTEESYFERFELPDSMMDIIRAEFAEYDLVPINWWLSVKKRNVYDFDHTHFSVHLDAYPDGTRFNAALIIPIEGYTDAPMIWFDGEFTDEFIMKEDYGYNKITWQNVSNMVIHKEDIVAPTICKIHIPHSTYSRHDGSYRAVTTVRFEGNPTFEEVCEKLSKVLKTS